MFKLKNPATRQLPKLKRKSKMKMKRTTVASKSTSSLSSRQKAVHSRSAVSSKC